MVEEVDQFVRSNSKANEICFVQTRNTFKNKTNMLLKGKSQVVCQKGSKIEN